MKKGVLLIALLLVLSIFSYSLVLAESSSDSGDDDNSEDSDSEDNDSDNEIESETEVESEDGKVKFEEKTRIGNLKREVKREMVDGVLREEIKEEWKNGSGEFKRETKLMLAQDREKRIIEFKAKIRASNGSIELDNRTIMIKELSDADKEIIAGKVNAKTGLNLSAEDIGNGSRGSILRAYLSNGNYAQINILPDRAADVAVERLKIACEERNCTVELKEVGNGNGTRAAYLIEGEKQARTLGIFKAKMKVRAEIDPETGEVVLVKKPWWAFLANELEEDESADPIESEEENESETENEIETNVSANVTVEANLTANTSA